MRPKTVRVFQVVRIQILTTTQYPHQKTIKIVLKMKPVSNPKMDEQPPAG
jgi:hypothetical protein